MPKQDEETDPKKDKEKDEVTKDLDYFTNKITSKKGQQQSFNVIPRDDKFIQGRYYGNQSTLGPNYRPNYRSVERNYGSDVKMTESNVVPRDKVLRLPECMLSHETLCNYDMRQVVKILKKKDIDTS